MTGRSLLDVYDAFSKKDMEFSVPLMLNGRQQDIQLGFIVQQDIAALYMQAVRGLKRYAAQACSPHGHSSDLFAKGVCQSLTLVTCVFETPCHLMRLFYRSPDDPRSHTNGAAHAAFLEQQVQSMCSCISHLVTAFRQQYSISAAYLTTRSCRLTNCWPGLRIPRGYVLLAYKGACAQAWEC